MEVVKGAGRPEWKGGENQYLHKFIVGSPKYTIHTQDRKGQEESQAGRSFVVLANPSSSSCDHIVPGTTIDRKPMLNCRRQWQPEIISCHLGKPLKMAATGGREGGKWGERE